MDAFIKTLQTQLQAPLPGRAAQYKMAHFVRQQYKPAPETATKAAVLALFYEKNKEPHLVLIERVSTNKNDRHSGQMSFPGGKQDADDKDISYTALRETEEEIGIPIKDVQIIGRLTNLYIPVSNFLVHPFVAYLEETPVFNAQESEVNQIVEVPFSLLQDKATRQKIDLRISTNMTLKGVPYFNVFGKVVWGATAMMLSELLELTGHSETVK